MSEYRFTGPFYNDNEDHIYTQPEAETAAEGEGVTDSVSETVSAETADNEAETENTSAGNEAETASADSTYRYSGMGAAESTGMGSAGSTYRYSGAGAAGQPYQRTAQGDVPPKQSPKQPKKKKMPGFGGRLLRTACIALVAGAVGGGAFLTVLHFGGEKLGIGKNQSVMSVDLQKNGTAVPYASTVKNSIDVSDIVEQCMPSVVAITTEGIQEIDSWFGTFQQPTSGSGSGIIIGENDTELLIATNYHVVSGSTNLNVFFSYDEDSEQRSAVSAKIKGYDSQKDLAVISVALSDIPSEARGKLTVATIGDSSQLKVGEQVVAIGNALGYGQTVTTGIVSARGREVSVKGTNGEVITNKLIQTDAAINPGNSGGALINMKGEIIGINSVKLVDQEVEGFGYAIPITDVENIIGDLMNKEIRDKVDAEKAGYLGITPVDVSADVSESFGLPVGVYIKNVAKGSAAEKAGLRAGDVIVRLDGGGVASTAELREALSYYEAGETIDMVVKTRESGYEEQTFTVTLSSAKEAGIR